MAILQYTVFDGAGATADGPVLNEGTVSIGGSSQQGGVIHAASSIANQIKRVRIAVDVDCWVTWGLNPTAANNGSDGRMMFSGTWEYFPIQADHKIAVYERV